MAESERRDFRIDEAELNHESGDIIDDILSDSVRQLQMKRTEVAALAFHQGYDGIDFIAKNRLPTMDKIRIGAEEPIAWHAPAPERRFGDNFLRFDFRQLTNAERQELLRFIGVYE